MKIEEIKALKVAELRAELSKLGLSTLGKKDELVERLNNHHKEIDAAIQKELESVVADDDIVFTEKELEQAVNEIENEPKLVSPVAISTKDEKERLQMRAQRFGMPSKEQAEKEKQKRAERFELEKAGLDADVLLKRKERFNFVGPMLQKFEADGKAAERVERFGLVDKPPKKNHANHHPYKRNRDNLVYK